MLEVGLVAQCEKVVAESPWVVLDAEAVERVADGVDPDALRVPDWSGDEMFESGSEAQVVGWLFAYNAVNFCYWPEPGQRRWFTRVDGRDVGCDDEALGVMAAFAAALRRGVPLDDGAYLADLGRADLDALLAPAPGAGPLPLLDERLHGLRELGHAWQRTGGPLAFLRVPGSSAPDVAAFVARELPSWRDERAWRQEVVRFRKRAQLCVAMVHGRLRGEGAGAFRHLDRLTVFADYRLPQVLRGLEVLRLRSDLRARIDGLGELPTGSEEEVSLRAATVAGAEALRRAWARHRPDLTALHVDYWLWRTAVDRDATLPPFHRTRCVDY